MKTKEIIAAGLLLAGCLTIGDKPEQIVIALALLAAGWAVLLRPGRRRQ